MAVQDRDRGTAPGPALDLRAQHGGEVLARARVWTPEETDAARLSDAAWRAFVPGTADPEAELLRLVDRQAFPLVYEQYQAPVRGLVRGMVRQDDAVDDVTAVTWNRFLNAMSAFEPHRGSLRSFLLRIAENAAWDYYRGRNRRAERNVVLAFDLMRDGDSRTQDELLEQFGSGALPSPERLLLDAEQRRACTALLDQLLPLVLATDSAPHELLSFLRVKALGWPPATVVDRLSLAALSDMEQQVEDDYLQESELPDDEVRPYFEKLHTDLALALGQCLLDDKMRLRYAALLQRIAGQTQLWEYYDRFAPAERAACAENVSRWCDNVRRRARKKRLREVAGGA